MKKAIVIILLICLGVIFFVTTPPITGAAQQTDSVYVKPIIEVKQDEAKQAALILDRETIETKQKALIIKKQNDEIQRLVANAGVKRETIKDTCYVVIIDSVKQKKRNIIQRFFGKKR